MKKFALVLFGLLVFGLKPGFALDIAGFESFFAEDHQNFELKENGTFEDGGFVFPYGYKKEVEYESWGGFVWSTHRDTYTRGFTNEHSAITEFGNKDSKVYCIAYLNSFMADTDSITLSEESEITGFYVTNTTYAYHSMNEGDDFAKRFGGGSGSDPDFFKLVVEGIDSSEKSTGTVSFYLADYRFDDNSKDYIVDDWEWVDLSSLGKVKKLKFSLSSSDEGEWGMNTPAYFAMDDLNGKPPVSNSGSNSSSSSSCFISGLFNKPDKNFVLFSAFVFSVLIVFSSKREKNED